MQTLIVDQLLHTDDSMVIAAPTGAGKTACQQRCPQKAHSHHTLRIIALSATLPNINDIGEWLHCSGTGLHTFDDSFRPVQLKFSIHKLLLINK